MQDGDAAQAASRAHKRHQLQQPFVCAGPTYPQGAMTRSAPWERNIPVALYQLTGTHLWLRVRRPSLPLRPGARRTLRLQCLTYGRLRVRIAYVDQPEKNIMRVRMLRPSRNTLAVLGLCALGLAQGDLANNNPQAIRRCGLWPIDASRCMTFSELKSADQMDEVIRLRFAVFKESALLKPSQKDPESTQDARDASSTIILGHARGQLVASCRAYAMGADDAYEFDAWCETTHVLPPKIQCVELGRAAIAVPFRNTGIPLTLMRMLTATAMTSGRRYMVLATTPMLVPFYKSFGFEVTALRFAYPGRNDFSAHVLVADLHRLWRGQNGNPLVWHALFGALSANAAQGFYAPRGVQDALRLSVLRRIGPVSRSVRRALGLINRLRQAAQV